MGGRDRGIVGKSSEFATAYLILTALGTTGVSAVCTC